jgi:uncharacterized hydantoinase/oxoprolinase family protein
LNFIFFCEEGKKKNFYYPQILKKKKITMKKINLFLNDLKIIFENKKFYDFEKNLNKNLILKLKNKLNDFEKKNYLNQISNIGCGGFHSFIYDNSFNF